MMSAPKKSGAEAVPANVTAQKLDTNQQGIPLPWFCGTRWFPVTWMVTKIYAPFQIPVQRKAGKGKTDTTYINAGSVAGLVCCGAVDYIDGLEIDNEIVWSGGIARDGSNPYFAGSLIPDLVGWRLMWGTSDQPADDLIFPTCGEDHPRYLDQCYLILKDLRFNGTTPPNVRVRIARSPRFTGLDEARTREGANPITAMAEVLADDFFGLAQPDLVDVATAAALADALKRPLTVSIPGNPSHSAQMGYLSPYLEKQQSIGDFFGGIMENYDGWLRRKDDKLEFGYFPHDGVIPTGLLELNLHDFESDPEFSGPGLDDESVITNAIVKGPDVDWNLEESSEPGGHTATRERLQESRIRTFSRPFVVTSYQKRAMASELEIYHARPGQVGTCQIRRERVIGLRPGDRFILTYDASSLTQIMRVEDRQDPGSGGIVTLRIVAERGLAPLAFVPTADLAPDSPSAPSPVVIANARAVQLPGDYTGLVIPVAVILAERPSANSSGFHVNFSVADATYDEMVTVTRWALRATLAGALTTGTLTFTVNASGHDLATLEAQSTAAQNDDTLLLFVGSEIFSIGNVTALGGGQYELTVLRARKGSTAAAHSSAAECYIIYRSDLVHLEHSDFPRAGGTRYFKIPSFTPFEEQDLASALKLTFSFADTRPAAPVLTAIAGTGKAISLSWPRINIASEYAIYRNTVDNFGTSVWQGEVSGLRFVDVNVALSTTYYYWVIAIDASEEDSAPSNSANATTAATSDGESVIIEYSIDGSTLWHSTFTAGDKFQRQKVGVGGTFTAAMRIDAEDGVDGDDAYFHFKFSNDGGATFTASSGAVVGKYIGTYSSNSPTPSSSVGSYTWILLQGYVDPTPPSNPAAPTLNSSTAYLSGDGTVLSRLVIAIPAMPTGGYVLNVLYRKSGATGWIVADQWDNARTDSPRYSTIDDLSPGIAYEVAVQAFTFDLAASAIITATGSPFTAPNKSTGPANPTGFAGNAPSATFPIAPRYFGATQIYGTTITFTRSADRDAAFYEFGISGDTVTPPFSVDTIVEASAEKFPIYSGTTTTQRLWVRTRDRTGNYSSWVDTGVWINFTLALSAGNLSSQNSDNASVSGLKIGSAGAGSVQQQKATAGSSVVVTMAGGSSTESFAISLSGKGFSFAPADGAVEWQDNGTPVICKYSLPASSSTSAAVVAYSLDGSPIAAGPMRFGYRFWE